MTSRTLRTAVLIAMAMGAMAGAAQGQLADAGPPDLADWAGYYVMARGEEVEGLRPVLTINELRQLAMDHLQPWALLKMESTDFVANDAGQICLPTGPFKYWFAVGRFLFLPGPDKIVMPFLNVPPAGVRRIYMNRGHPRNLRPTWNGDSIGHWEGDTLVVDSVGFNDKSWLVKVEPHTEELHVIERIRRVKGGSLLEFDITFMDREALTSAYNFVLYFRKADLADLDRQDGQLVNVCNEDPELWRQIMDMRLQPLLQRSREVR